MDTRSNPVLGWIFIVLGGVLTVLGLWLALLGAFSFTVFLGPVLVLAGVAQLVRARSANKP
jgi:uncharacterized membrane protein HdeD (DUF308 family)